MHYALEIFMPPVETNEIYPSIKRILRPFYEKHSIKDYEDWELDQFDQDECDYFRRYAFWDYWVIGGRFAGNKALAKLDPVKLEAFENWIREAGITVSGVQFGKHQLSPASNIIKVDAKWNEMFPPTDGKPVPCPLFQHSNDQFAEGLVGTITGDVMVLADVPPDYKVSHVIFSGPSSHQYTGPLEAKYMIETGMWNGLNHVQTEWDGRLCTALEIYQRYLKNTTDIYQQAMSPSDDWLVVTVDYHN